jgi:hypothetical protein
LLGFADKNVYMRRYLQFAIMATVTAAFFSSQKCVLAATDPGKTTSGITSTTDNSGRTIYVNDTIPVPSSRRNAGMGEVAPSNHLVYWSSTEHRWKPVPSANVRAARSAAAEVTPQFAGALQSKAFSQEDIDAAIDQAAARHNVDPNLVRAVIKVESNFNPNAISRKGAMGLMQLMPQTARQLNVTNPFDPEQNVDAGVRHLKKLMESYGGNVKLSLAAYNAGARAVARNAGVPHFAENRNYVKRLTQLYYEGSDPGSQLFASPVHAPIHVERDSQGVLHFSNTD